MELPEIAIREDDRLKLVVSTDEDPAMRVLLVDITDDDGKVHMSEIGISPRNVEKLKKQATRSVMRYQSKDGALTIEGQGARWTLLLRVEGHPRVDVALDERETLALKAALFEPLPAPGQSG